MTQYDIIAKRRETRGLTQTGQILGTIDYAAPEQISGETVDARTDVYGLGCLLFEALTGGVPFPRPTAPAAMIAHPQETPPVVSERAAELGTSFDRVLSRALANSPDERFPSTGALAAAAMAATEGRRPASLNEPSRGGRRRPAWPRPPLTRVLPPRRPSRLPPAGPSTPPTVPASPSPPQGEPASSPRRRRRPVALGGVLLLIAGAAAALLLSGLLGTDDQNGGRAAPGVTAPSVASPTATAPPTAPTQSGAAVPKAQANALADRYPAAYEGETLDAMRAILAPDVELTGPGTFASGREEVLSEYRSTFGLIEDPRYQLRDRTYNEKSAGPTVQGVYEATDSASGATATGRLLLTMRRIDGKPLITRIVTTG